ncbi:MAG: von Willebrand factor type A domain-containing protein, partial [Myxococcota bacterium]
QTPTPRTTAKPQSPPKTHAQPSAPPPPGRSQASTAHRTSRDAHPPREAPPAPVVEAEEEPHPTSSGGEGYEDYGVNNFVDPRQDSLSTFAIDVDTASYTIMRRKLTEGTLPPHASVRVEEFVNYFKYNYAQPDDNRPFGVHFEAAPSPFDTHRTFLRVGVQGKRINPNQRPPIHLTFLVDTSGSMQSHDKMGLLKQALMLLVNNLRSGDTVALATYAGHVSRVLDPTDAREVNTIHNAIERLSAGGSTAMNSGLELAYQMAYSNFQPGHVNRVIVCSDGDANVGPSSHRAILDRIRHFTQEGVTLSTIGFGMGNYKDVMMEQLADSGNGNYYYIDTLKQARRVFQDDLLGTLIVIAKDVKIQVEFDPNQVAAYRLIGYENRDVADIDFRNDAVDAGEIGSGHNVTAVYEVKLKSGSTSARRPFATTRIRHKTPTGSQATESTYGFTQQHMASAFAHGSSAFRLAVSVAAFAEVLRDSPHAREWSLHQVRALAQDAAGDREDEQELVRLIDRAIQLMPSAMR